MNSLGLKNESVLCFLSLFSLTHFAIVCTMCFLVLHRLFFGAPRLTHE